MLSGEPDYRSVNITWAIDDPTSTDNESGNDSDPAVTDETLPITDYSEVPQFTVFYCEMQSWGAHRCKSQLVKESNEVDSNEQ